MNQSSLYLREDIPALTVLRGFAALLIVVHHFSLLVLPFRGTLFAPAFGKLALLGMSVFFVLSGFVIHYNYGEKINTQPRGIRLFLLARFARLMPLYLAFVLLNFVYNVAYPDNGRPTSYVHALPVNLLAAQSWTFGTVDGLPRAISQVYANAGWSISTEIMLYLLFIPFALCIRFNRASVTRGILIIAAGMIGRVMVVKLAGYDPLINWMEARGGPGASHWITYYSPYGRWFEFMAGVGLSEIWLATRHKPKRGHPVAVILGMIGLSYIGLSFFDQTLVNMPKLFGEDRIYSGYGFAVPLTIYFFCVLDSRKILALRAKFLIWVGEISYSLYLVHGDMIPFFQGPGGTAALIMKAIMFFSILFVIATLIHVYFEIPTKKWIIARTRSLLSRLDSVTAGQRG
ncbi:hypothetical protein R69608_04230 [Paraburkholderia nemoris]|uniref:acyltransferase family protein n=1 Tax=Paraburkholderia nemoris TaxID=2793076 RepID=UPI00191187DD|nr:acyltransferase [Paraburkholderia nemoris]MBK5151794.1 acyltransferase [Burkholderia sp. R-69608]CAE6923479.1 hypothetical protein R69608_04230 [Paraburkholderia nemoris]